MTNSGVRKTAIKAKTLQGFVLNLRKIPGYEACGILSFKGKMLARDQAAETVDVELLGATFNDLLQQSKAAAENAGMDGCSQFSIRNPAGRLVLIHCSGINTRLHFHLLVSLGEESGLSLVEQEINSFLDLVKQEFAG